MNEVVGEDGVEQEFLVAYDYGRGQFASSADATENQRLPSAASLTVFTSGSLTGAEACLSRLFR
jgi:hypothetical protein